MMVWQAAEQAARKVWEAYRTPQGLADLPAICEALDLRVTYSRHMTDGVSGMIVKRAGEPGRVYINSLEPEPRQTFTLAHEIGHLVERLTIANDDEFSFTDQRGGNYDLHEFYADQFAGALLMPQPLVEAMCKDLYEPDTSTFAPALQISQHFGVTVAAAEKRIERLRKQRGHGLQSDGRVDS